MFERDQQKQTGTAQRDAPPNEWQGFQRDFFAQNGGETPYQDTKMEDQVGA
jgi:hypothetical protein